MITADEARKLSVAAWDRTDSKPAASEMLQRFHDEIHRNASEGRGMIRILVAHESPAIVDYVRRKLTEGGFSAMIIGENLEVTW